MRKFEKMRAATSCAWLKSLGSAQSVRILPAMSSMNVLDTNIWLYIHDTRDPTKQAIAQHLTQTVRPLYLPGKSGVSSSPAVGSCSHKVFLPIKLGRR